MRLRAGWMASPGGPTLARMPFRRRPDGQPIDASILAGVGPLWPTLRRGARRADSPAAGDFQADQLNQAVR